MNKSQQVRFLALVLVVTITSNIIMWSLLTTSPSMAAPAVTTYSDIASPSKHRASRGTPIDAPRLIPFQAILTDTSGRPVEGSHNFTFKIYDRATEGAPLWTETRTGIAITKGIVNVVLGSVNPFGAVSFDGELYLGVTVDANPEMVPRQQLISAIFAADADRAELAELAAEATHAIDADQAISSNHAHDLVVPGTANSVVTVSQSGNVGIGVSSPASKLSVDGGIAATGELSGFGVVPIGSIIAWHQDLAGVPPLPNGWIRCTRLPPPNDVIDVAGSPLNGQLIPELNNFPSSTSGGGMFLRGRDVSGVTQPATFVTDNLGVYCPSSNVGYEDGAFGSGCGNAHNFANASGPYGYTFNCKTVRPVNMSVVWIMRVK